MHTLQLLCAVAASYGKDFDALAAALLDAGHGQFERLKEFGTRAKADGDQVSLDFRGQQLVVANNSESVYTGILVLYGRFFTL